MEEKEEIEDLCDKTLEICSHPLAENYTNKLMKTKVYQKKIVNKHKAGNKESKWVCMTASDCPVSVDVVSVSLLDELLKY